MTAHAGCQDRGNAPGSYGTGRLREMAAMHWRCAGGSAYLLATPHLEGYETRQDVVYAGTTKALASGSADSSIIAWLWFQGNAQAPWRIAAQLTVRQSVACFHHLLVASSHALSKPQGMHAVCHGTGAQRPGHQSSSAGGGSALGPGGLEPGAEHRLGRAAAALARAHRDARLPWLVRHACPCPLLVEGLFLHCTALASTGRQKLPPVEGVLTVESPRA